MSLRDNFLRLKTAMSGARFWDSRVPHGLRFGAWNFQAPDPRRDQQVTLRLILLWCGVWNPRGIYWLHLPRGLVFGILDFIHVWVSFVQPSWFCRVR